MSLAGSWINVTFHLQKMFWKYLNELKFLLSLVRTLKFFRLAHIACRQSSTIYRMMLLDMPNTSEACKIGVLSPFKIWISGLTIEMGIQTLVQFFTCHRKRNCNFCHISCKKYPLTKLSAILKRCASSKYYWKKQLKFRKNQLFFNTEN